MSATLITTTDQDEKQRLDVFLTQKIEKSSRSTIQKQIKAGDITVNEKTVTPHYALRSGDVIRIKEQPTKFPLPKIKVVFSNDDFIIIQKPAGALSQPLSNKAESSVIEAVAKKFPEIIHVGEEQQRSGLVHRLDRDVSGLMIIARNQKSFEYFKQQFKLRTIQKEYTALVHNVITLDDEGRIEFPISRSNSGRMRATPIHTEGKKAITAYKIIKRYMHHTLLTAIPKTGRMHQIRVHLKSIGHPIVGDTLYTLRRGTTDTSLGRIFLHATRLQFIGPDGESYTFKSALPTTLKKYLTEIK